MGSAEAASVTCGVQLIGSIHHPPLLLNGEGTCTPQIKFGEKCEGNDGCFSCQNGICKDPLEGTCK